MRSLPRSGAGSDPLPGWFRVTALVAVALAVAIAGIRAMHRDPPLPRLYALPPFSLLDDAGAPFGPDRLAGKASIVNFIFTSCPTVCPALTAKMARLQGTIAEPGVQFISVSVDPTNDTPEVLRAYGARFGRDPQRWTFVTGELEAVKRAVEEGFRVAMEGADRPNATAWDIVHGEHFVLVDRSGIIRGFYRPEDDDLARLARDAVRLSREFSP